MLAILGRNGENPFFRSKAAQNGPLFSKIDPTSFEATEASFDSIETPVVGAVAIQKNRGIARFKEKDWKKI